MPLSDIDIGSVAHIKIISHSRLNPLTRLLSYDDPYTSIFKKKTSDIVMKNYKFVLYNNSDVNVISTCGKFKHN